MRGGGVSAVTRVRQALISVTPDYKLKQALSLSGVIGIHHVNRETLNAKALEFWPRVETCCYEWIECGRVRNQGAHPPEPAA